LYRNACFKLGIDKSSLFDPYDLYSAKDLNQVYQNLYALSEYATRRGVKGSGPTPSLTPKLARKYSRKIKIPTQEDEEKRKKWAPVNTTPQYKHVDSIQKEKTIVIDESMMKTLEEVKTVQEKQQSQIEELKIQVAKLKRRNWWWFGLVCALACLGGVVYCKPYFSSSFTPFLTQNDEIVRRVFVVVFLVFI